MRPKVVLALGIIAFCFVGGTLLVGKFFQPESTPAPEPVTNAAVPVSNSVSSNKPFFSERLNGMQTSSEPAPQPPDTSARLDLGSLSTKPSQIDTNLSELEQSKITRKRVVELYSIAMKDDLASRDIILAELKNENPKIRQAALQSAIQFNDRSVVPYLRDAADLAEDPREKAAILEAIDYINLPSLSEYLTKIKENGGNIPVPQIKRKSPASAQGEAVPK